MSFVEEIDQVGKLLAGARNFLSMKDYARAGELFDKVTELEPDNWRGIFYSQYCRAFACKVREVPSYIDIFARGTINIPNLVSMQSVIPENSFAALREYFTHLCQVNAMLVGALSSVYEDDPTDENKNRYWDNGCMAYGMQLSLINNWLTNPDFIFAAESISDYAEFRSYLLINAKVIYHNVHTLTVETSYITSLFSLEAIDRFEGAWVKIFYTNGVLPALTEEDPDYVNPSMVAFDQRREYVKAHPQKTSASGCYVATCVYGSYDCPQVWTLRRYRDNTLASTWYGKAFIHVYYAVSPIIVKWFGNAQWFQKFWRKLLDKMVSRLRSDGVEDTPYRDRGWR